MGSCQSALRRPTRDVVVMIIGLEGAGKSSILNSFSRDTVTSYGSAISYRSAMVQQGKYSVALFDMAGAARFRALWQNFFAKVHAFMFVVDSSASDRMSEAKTCLDEVLTHTKAKGKPVLVLANKQDSDDPLDEIAVFTKLGLERYQAEHSLSCQVECCTASRQDKRTSDPRLKSGLTWLCSAIDSQYGMLAARVQLESAQQDAEDERLRRGRIDRLHSQRMEREQTPRTASTESSDTVKHLHPQASQAGMGAKRSRQSRADGRASQGSSTAITNASTKSGREAGTTESEAKSSTATAVVRVSQADAGHERFSLGGRRQEQADASRPKKDSNWSAQSVGSVDLPLEQSVPGSTRAYGSPAALSVEEVSEEESLDGPVAPTFPSKLAPLSNDPAVPAAPPQVSTKRKHRFKTPVEPIFEPSSAPAQRKPKVKLFSVRSQSVTSNNAPMDEKAPLVATSGQNGGIKSVTARHSSGQSSSLFQARRRASDGQVLMPNSAEPLTPQSAEQMGITPKGRLRLEPLKKRRQTQANGLT